MTPDQVKRRLVVILSADVVGYSRLMGEDESGTLSRLKAIRKELVDPKIAEYRGRIVKTTGDGILIEFKSVADAVLHGVEIQRAMILRNAGLSPDNRIEFRIGINLGEIIVEGRDIYGDGVNVAARLQAIAEPGGICVSGRVHDEIAGKIDLGFEDLGAQALKNITRAVRVFQVKLDDGKARGAAPVEKASAAEAEGGTLALPDKPSIAVLPLANMSGDAEQDYFADGITEDIITALSRIRWLFVIARNSTFVYKGRAVDVKQVARDLGVRYVLEGSVRKIGTRVRISAQLIDVASGAHHWAERYDRELTDIFALQDEITQNVAAAIEPKLLAAEGIRSQSRSPKDLDSWDLLMRANSLFLRLNKADTEAAIAILEEAVKRYPHYAPTHSMLAFALLVSGHMGWILLEPQLQRAGDLANRAAELDDSDPWAHLALGYLAFAMRRTDEASHEFHRALDLNPNFAAASGYLGLALAFDGRTAEALTHLQQAMRISPQDPQNAIFNNGLCAAHYLAGRYADAVSFGRKAVQQRPGYGPSYRIFIASLAQAGQIDEAGAMLARLKVLQPNLSLEWVKQNAPYTAASMAHFIEGLRKAGLE